MRQATATIRSPCQYCHGFTCTASLLATKVSYIQLYGLQSLFFFYLDDSYCIDILATIIIMQIYITLVAMSILAGALGRNLHAKASILWMRSEESSVSMPWHSLHISHIVILANYEDTIRHERNNEANLCDNAAAEITLFYCNDLIGGVEVVEYCKDICLANW